MADFDNIKLPPHNIEAEKWVISAVFIENEKIYELDGLFLEPADFYQKEHQIIYEVIKDLWAWRKTIDVVTVSDWLKKKWDLESIWWIDYLYELSTFLPTATVLSDYAKIVKEKAILRMVLKTCQQVIWDVYDERDFHDIREKIEKKIFSLTQINMSDSLKHIKEVLDWRSTHYMEIVDDPTILDRNKVWSWYENLDELLWWFKPWDLVIVAARPSMWKTSFALNLAVNAAIKQKKSVAIFSLEMGNEQIADRVISCVAQIPMFKIHKWLLDEEDFANIWEAMEKISDTNIYVDDRGGSTVSELKSKLRKLRIERWNLDLVIIDYLQLMTVTNVKVMWNRVQEISEISRWLKELARELKVPIIALSQLSRWVEQRQEKKPQLSDLRESGAIEQDADSVLMLYRDDYYDPDSEEKGMADILVRKNRNGPTWDIKLVFVKDTMKFYEKANDSNNNR